VDFFRLKNASIVEQENTMKKQLSCVFPVAIKEQTKGELELILSIEDFGDVEHRESFATHPDVSH